MTMQQFELFPMNEVDQLRLELQKVKQSQENVRRGLFARHSELSKLFLELREDYDAMSKVMLDAVREK